MKSQHPADGWTALAGRALISLTLALTLCTLLPVARSADDAPGSDLQFKLDRRGSIILGENSTLSQWIVAIQQEWNVNIVCSGDLQAKMVSGGFTDTPLRSVLNSILYTSGCGYEIVGDSLLIQRLEDMGAIKPQFELAIIPLEYLSPTEAQPTVQIMLSKNGTVQVIPSSKSLMVADLPERIVKVREHLRFLEDHAKQLAEKNRPATPAVVPSAGGPNAATGSLPGLTDGPPPPVPNRVEVFTTQFVKADLLTTALQSALGNETGARVSAVQGENRLVVVGPPESVEMASHILGRLDVPQPQVRISAILYDVTLDTMERLGVNWNHVIKGRINASGDPQSLLEMDSNMFARSIPTAGSGGGSGSGDGSTAAISTAVNGMWTLANFSRHFDLVAFIQALDQTDGARLLARPTIMAYNRAEAEIKIVSEIPVQQLTQTQQGGDIGTTEFREAGIVLRVTPEILADGTVILQVEPEFSVLAGYSAEGQPIIDRRTTRTRVQVLNGQTFVIGGLLRRNEMETVTGIPGLMHWKFIGKLFRNHDTTVTDSELLVFIRTEIIVPECSGQPREWMALAAAEERLAQIPHATNYPFIPPCNDPHCPYHCPRPYGGPPAAMCLHYDGQQVPAAPPAEQVPAQPYLAPPLPPQPSPVHVEEASYRAETPASRSLVQRLPSVGGATRPTRPPVAPPELPSPALAAAEDHRKPVPPSSLAVPPPLPADHAAPAVPPGATERIGQRGLWLDDVFRR